MSEKKFLKCTCGQCGGRIEFPAEGIGMTAPCPHCGWQTELALEPPEEEPGNSPRSLKWVIAGVAILIIGVLGATGAFLGARHLLKKKGASRPALQAARPNKTNALSTPKAMPLPAAGPTISSNGFSASVVKIEKAAGSSLVYAVGTLKNETDQQRFGVTVELDLFDDAGARVGGARDYKDLIEPRREWTFRASVLKKGVAVARIAAVQEQP